MRNDCLDCRYLSVDGRRICYQLFGDPRGFPMLYCHGFPASRLEARLAHAAGQVLGVCLIAADRPGFGRSDFQPGRQMRDWVDIAKALMDSLGYQRFSVLGVSGGGPYAMLLGEYLSDRIHRLGIVGGLGDLTRPGSEGSIGPAQQRLVRFARAHPQWALFLYHYAVGTFMQKFPRTARDILTVKAPAVDRAELAKPEIDAIFLDSIREAFAQGGRGAAWELVLFTNRWEADPTAVKTETFLWHGELDATVPVSMGRQYAELIPNCTAEIMPNEGHFSLPVKHVQRILAKLIPET